MLNPDLFFEVLSSVLKPSQHLEPCGFSCRLPRAPAPQEQPKKARPNSKEQYVQIGFLHLGGEKEDDQGDDANQDECGS